MSLIWLHMDGERMWSPLAKRMFPRFTTLSRPEITTIVERSWEHRSRSVERRCSYSIAQEMPGLWFTTPFYSSMLEVECHDTLIHIEFMRSSFQRAKTLDNLQKTGNIIVEIILF